MTVIVVALFGFGQAGKIHFGNLLSNRRCSLKYVLEDDVNGSGLQPTAHSLLGTKNHVEVCNASGFKKVLEDESVRAVVIATPTDTHHLIIMAALQHGKHVFVEKPVADSAAKIVECYDLASAKNLLLFCSFNRRFDPGLIELHQKLRQRSVGETVHTLKTTSRDHPKRAVEFLKRSNGIFHDCAVHDLDLMCWLLGEFPISINVDASCHSAQIGKLGDVDATLITCKFKSGALGSIDLNRYAAYGYDQRVEILGSHGMLETRNEPRTNVTVLNSEGVQMSPIALGFKQKYKESYENAMDEFLSIVQNGGNNSGKCVTKSEVVTSWHLAELCGISYKENRKVQVPQEFISTLHPHNFN